MFESIQTFYQVINAKWKFGAHARKCSKEEICVKPRKYVQPTPYRNLCRVLYWSCIQNIYIFKRMKCEQ